MRQYPFIFSNERNYRFRRHFAFWATWWLFAGFLYAPVTFGHNLGYFKNLSRSLLESLAFLPIHMSLAYSLIYFIIPRYLFKGKYALSTLLVLISYCFSALVSVLISVTIIPLIREQFHLPDIPAYRVNASFQYALMAGLRGGITMGGLAAAIKLMKHWYLEGQRNLQLQKENVESQLQVLKAQLHPHFLFNTLNNIYSKTQKTAPEASEMIFGLSDILRHMLYDCNKPMVPLMQELKMIEEYINLEKIRYGNKLELHIDLPCNTGDYFIAPLMILPFVENCFKHGTSTILEQPWINLTITIEQEEMTMKLLNSKSSGITSTDNSGIGIENVKKRLALLYPDKHQLTIQQEDEVFIVILKLQLEKRTPQTITVNKPTFSSIAN